MRPRSLTLCAGLLVGAIPAATPPLLAQTHPGEVLFEVEISNSNGGLNPSLLGADDFGGSIAWIGDLNGNGTPDLLVGAPRHEDSPASCVTGPGAVFVLFLKPDGTVASQRKISATQGDFAGPLDCRDDFGAAVACLGDVDGDGVTDVAVGAAGDDVDPTELDVGAVWILFLKSNGKVKAAQRIGAAAGGFTGALEDGDRFGRSLAGLGDLDGDGVPDLAVGAPFDDDARPDAGAVWILFLRSDGTVKRHAKIRTRPGVFDGQLLEDVQFGHSLANLGDLDGDGVVDLAVGAPWDSEVDFTSGAVWILFLRPNGTVEAHRKIAGPKAGLAQPLGWNYLFGRAVAALGDLNRDGVPDLAVGSHRDGSTLGVVWMLYLEPSGRVASQSKISELDGSFGGDTSFGLFANSLAGGADFDGNGVADLAVGHRFQEGRVWTLSLNASEWRDVGGGTSGVGGAPVLSGAGTLLPGTSPSLALTGAAPSVPVALVYGAGFLGVPYKGGTLVPTLDRVLFSSVDGGGELGLTFPAPSGLPPAATLYFQAWISDPSGVGGLVGSNGLSARTP